jgi:hypothetical protein
MKSALFTILRDEPIFLEIFLDYYSKYFDSNDIYILHHESGNDFDSWIYKKYENESNIETISYEETFDHEWLRSKVKDKQKELLKNYDIVVFAEIDEIIWHPLGLDRFIKNLKGDVATCRGLEIVHHFNREPALDLSSRPLLQQRNWCYYAQLYNKTLISKIPLDWIWGFHTCPQQVTPNIDLHLIHLHKLDFDICWRRNLSHRHTLLEGKEITDDTPGVQNLRQKREWLENWFMLSVDECIPGEPAPQPTKHIEIPKYIKNAI